MNLTLQITMKSDWHVGTGAGIPGFIDRQVLRDRDGLPYIPAKTLTGILRDSAELVAKQLDVAAGGQFWSGRLETLFGGQPESHRAEAQTDRGAKQSKNASLCLRAGKVDGNIRKYLADQKRAYLRDALYFIQPGVTIESSTGKAEAGHLFFTEQVMAKTTLSADMEFVPHFVPQKADLALLEAACAGVRRLGGKRRRGGGECEFLIVGLPETGESQPDWLAWLQDNYKKGEKVLAEPVTDVVTTLPSRRSTAPTEWKDTAEDWISIPLTLTAKTPLIVHDQTVGNVVSTLDYIPGTMLLAPLFRRMVGANLDEEKLRQAISTGQLVITNFVPTSNGKISYPVPQTLSHPKDVDGLNRDDGQVLNNLVEEKKPNIQYKGYRSGWVAFHEGLRPSYISDDKIKSQAMHNTIEDIQQRPTEEVGGVYTYEYVKAGQSFTGSLRIHRKSFQALGMGDFSLEVFDGPLRVGRSKKDDYGLCELKATSTGGKDELNILPPKDDRLVIWLLSDVLLRDEYQTYSANPSLLVAALEKSLGLGLKIFQGDGKHISSIGRAHRLESWHRGWNLPRPSLVGMQAGSVFSFKITGGDWDQAKAKQLQEEGIGERRAEGFGRIAINPEFLFETNIKPIEIGKKLATDSAGLPTGADLGMIYDLEEIAWKKEIRRLARNHAYGSHDYFKASNWGTEEKPVPSKSQWGALRSAAQACTNRGDLAPLKNWVKGVRDTSNRQEKWVKDNVDRLAVIEELINGQSKEKARELLDIRLKPISSTSAGKWPSDELWRFAVCALIENVCEAVVERANKNKKKGGRG